MSKYRDKTHNRNVIIVFVWILMTMISMCMVVMVWREELLYDIYSEESSDKSIYSHLRLLKRLWQYMYECDREHRTSTETDEEVQIFAWDSPLGVEEKSCRRYECEYDEWEEHRIEVRY